MIKKSKEKEYKKLYKLSCCLDESIVQTILFNSEFYKNCFGKNMRYIDFPEGDSHPKDLTLDCFEDLEKSDCLFARKFNQKVDSKVIDMVIENLSK